VEPKKAKQKMIYPHNFEEKIGFNSIRLILSKHILCPLGKKNLDNLNFIDDAEMLQIKLNQVNELANLMRSGASFPGQDYLDPTTELKRIKTPGTAIELESAVDLRISSNTILEIQHFLAKQNPQKVEYLLAISNQAYVEPKLLKEIDRIIDDKGLVRSSASANLKEIRNSMVRKHRESESRMAQIFSKVKKEGLTGEDLQIAIRNGRQVIPVPAACKRKIKGFVHDESATGQTVFIEPAEIFEINNEIRELENAEIREIIKILTGLADFIRPYIDSLLVNFQILGEFDFIRAKAKLAIEINARLPHFKSEPIVDWINATHPILYLSHRAQKKTIVPLNLSLNNEKRMLLISGPNAGGKSVALKTTGLLQYMLQCGLLIPVDDNSTAGIFRNIFIDIGDEQSLEHDLSTYTSHLKNLKHFIEYADANTLILIDEFGTGTEPQLGGAIAEAALEDFARKLCFGVITTHYANLKEAAGRIEGIANGAMLFDPKSLSPLFILKTGNPGSSYAFEIADKIGFPKNLLEIAAGKISQSAIDYDKLLQELEVEKAALLEKQTGLNVADDFLAELIERYNRLNAELKTEKEKIILQAKDEASRIIEKSNKLIENTIRGIKESQAEKQAVSKLRNDVKEYRQALETKAEVKAETPSQNDDGPSASPPVLQVGSWARIKNQNIVGKIIEIREQEIILEAGQMILHVKSDKVMTSKPPAFGKSTSSGSRHHTTYQNIQDMSANFKLSIDLRGKKADEALEIVTKHVEDAVFLNIPEITIIHGKGDGVLRQVIRDYLKNISEVKSLNEGHPDRGGAGMTIVSFRI
jgi:DNA mismatch repair protein MutS2